MTPVKSQYLVTDSYTQTTQGQLSIAHVMKITNWTNDCNEKADHQKLIKRIQRFISEMRCASKFMKPSHFFKWHQIAFYVPKCC